MERWGTAKTSTPRTTGWKGKLAWTKRVPVIEKLPVQKKLHVGSLCEEFR